MKCYTLWGNLVMILFFKNKMEKYIVLLRQGQLSNAEDDVLHQRITQTHHRACTYLEQFGG